MDRRGRYGCEEAPALVATASGQILMQADRAETEGVDVGDGVPKAPVLQHVRDAGTGAVAWVVNNRPPPRRPRKKILWQPAERERVRIARNNRPVREQQQTLQEGRGPESTRAAVQHLPHPPSATRSERRASLSSHTPAHSDTPLLLDHSRRGSRVGSAGASPSPAAAGAVVRAMASHTSLRAQAGAGEAGVGCDDDAGEMPLGLSLADLGVDPDADVDAPILREYLEFNGVSMGAGGGAIVPLLAATAASEDTYDHLEDDGWSETSRTHEFPPWTWQDDTLRYMLHESPYSRSPEYRHHHTVLPIMPSRPPRDVCMTRAEVLKTPKVQRAYATRSGPQRRHPTRGAPASTTSVHGARQWSTRVIESCRAPIVDSILAPEVAARAPRRAPVPPRARFAEDRCRTTAGRHVVRDYTGGCWFI